MKKMSLNTKLARNLLNQLKNIPRNYTFLILFSNTNITQAWQVIKESVGKGKCNHQSFPKKIKLDGKNMTDEDVIAKQFNTYFGQVH